MAIKVNSVVVIDNDRNVSSGILTASSVSANEFVGTGDKLIFSPSATSFSPISGATNIGLSTSISITFDQPIYAGVGTITLRNSSGIGTIIESIGIGSTLINNQTLTLTPSSSLPLNTNVYVVLPQGVIKNSVGGNNALLNTYNFTTLNVAFQSINPTDGATNIGLSTNITLTFTAAPTQGTGTIELKSGSTSGPIIESFDAASSGRISVSGNDWILDPTNNLDGDTTVFPVIPSTAIQNYVGLNTTGASSYSFTTRNPILGEAYGGGYLICQAGGTRWVVAPSTSEVTRSWYSRDDASTRAQQVSGCTGWFIPTLGQLQNPGYACRNYWDSYTATCYWSNTASPVPHAACLWNFDNNAVAGRNRTNLYLVRAFRVVSY